MKQLILGAQYIYTGRASKEDIRYTHWITGRGNQVRRL